MLASKWSESSGTLSSTYQVSNPHRLPQRCYRAKNPVWTWHLLHNPCPGPGYSLIKPPSRYPFHDNWLNCLENLSWSSGFKKRCCRRWGEAGTPLTLLESGTSACAGSTTIIKTSSSFFFCLCHLPNTYFGTSGPNTYKFFTKFSITISLQNIHSPYEESEPSKETPLTVQCCAGWKAFWESGRVYW